MAAIHFLGAAQTVTGSRHLVEHEGRRVLLDCGLFQGIKRIRKQNWDRFPVTPRSIDAVVLSHAHIDHTGWLPRLINEGYRGPIYATPATRDLLAIMLPDSGRLHEEEARYANRKGFSKHRPALPLYTEEDAVRCIPKIRAITYDEPREVAPGMTVTYHRAGHILGSAVVQLDLAGGDADGHRIIFSGDLGRPHTPIIPDPDPIPRATTLLLECTYGDRLHDQFHPVADLAREVKDMVARKGVLIIPAFAIGRTQHILYYLRELQDRGEIPELPIFVDSPMACNATPLYLMHREEHDREMAAMLVEGDEPLHPERVSFARSVEASKAINERNGPLIIISASGMATGGRVLHHLKRRLGDDNTTVLFVGYQAIGTRGRRLLDGEKQIRIHGHDWPVKAKIGQIYGFSAHADYGEVDQWLSHFGAPPKRTFCIHGEPDALRATVKRLSGRGWNAYAPEPLERIEL
jgi:metallo-beta-lactamase family protein